MEREVEASRAFQVNHRFWLATVSVPFVSSPSPPMHRTRVPLHLGGLMNVNGKPSGICGGHVRGIWLLTRKFNTVAFTCGFMDRIILNQPGSVEIVSGRCGIWAGLLSGTRYSVRPGSNSGLMYVDSGLDSGSTSGLTNYSTGPNWAWAVNRPDNSSGRN